MKLPGINYTTAVGPDISGLPLQEARAWSNAANSWAQAIDNVGLSVEEAERQEKMIGAQAEAKELERRLSRPVWNVSEFGEPPADITIKSRDTGGPQPFYRTHEFAGQLYDKEIKRIGEKYGEGLSARAKRKFNQDFMKYVIQQRNSVLETQYKGAQSHRQGVTAKALEMATQNVEWNDRYDVIDTANELINEQYRNGDIDLEEVVKKQARYRDLILENAIRRDLADAGEDVNHLNALDFLVSREPLLDDKVRDRFSTLIERRINRVERKLQAEDKKNREAFDADNTIDYLRGDISVEEAIERNRTSGTPANTIRIGKDAYNRNTKSTEYSDPVVKDEVNDMMSVARSFPTESNITLIEEQLIILEGEGKISGSDGLDYKQQLAEIRRSRFTSNDYQRQEDEIHILIVGSPKNDEFSYKSPQNLVRYNDAVEAMRDAIRYEGLTPQEFWERDSQEFLDPRQWNAKKIRNSGLPPQLLVIHDYDPKEIMPPDDSTAGTVDWQATVSKWDQMVMDGLMSIEDQKRYLMDLKRLEREMGVGEEGR